MCACVCLSVCLSVYIFLYVSLSINLLVFLPVYLAGYHPPASCVHISCLRLNHLTAYLSSGLWPASFLSVCKILSLSIIRPSKATLRCKHLRLSNPHLDVMKVRTTKQLFGWARFYSRWANKTKCRTKNTARQSERKQTKPKA